MSRGEVLYVDTIVVDDDGNACCVAHTSTQIIVTGDYADGRERIMVIATPSVEEGRDG